MYSPLPRIEIPLKPYQSRVMFLDPVDIYERIAPILETKKRFPRISITEIFPHVKGVCGCGCGAKLTGVRRRWHTDDCSRFASCVWAIINGQTVTIGYYIERYYGRKCYECGAIDGRQERSNGMCVSTLQIDHTIPVKHGGGGSWLSNYKFLCPGCHKRKTRSDFGYKQSKSTQ